MDDLDNITDEEQALADELAALVDDAKSQGPASPSTTMDLVAQAALLRASTRFEISSVALRDGNAEVLRFSQKHLEKQPRSASPARRWFSASWLVWLPVPAVALLSLWVFSSRNHAELATHARSMEAPATSESSEERKDDALQLFADEQAPGALPEQGNAPGSSAARLMDNAPSSVPRDLLLAQADVLATKGPERDVARQRLEQQMQSYRKVLLAQLDQEGGQ